MRGEKFDIMSTAIQHAAMQDRLKATLARIEAASRETGRDPADVQLVAVSKTFGADEILPVLEAGQRVFGENRVQEAKGKWPALRERFPDIELHLIRSATPYLCSTRSRRSTVPGSPKQSRRKWRAPAAG
jgi:hypothetical protein